MSVQTIVTVGITLSVFLTVLTIGMRVSPADLQHVFSQPRQLARSLLAMFVLAPLIAIIACKTFALHPAVIVALTTLSVAPVGGMFSKGMLPLVAPDKPAYARGLLFASTVLSVVLTPLAVEVIQAVFGKGEAVHVSPLAIGEVVIASVLLPLGIGFAFGRRWPAARQWVPAIQKVSGVVLLVCALAIIAGTWSLMGSIVRHGTLSAIVLITLAGLVAGHLLGGPGEDDRTVLAFATVSRHPGVAVAVASLTDQPLAPIGVLLAVLVGELAVIPYKTWRKRRRAAAAQSAAGPAAGAH